MVLGVPQGCILDAQLFLLYTSEHFSLRESNSYGYADNSTLVAILCHPMHGERVALGESLNRGLILVRELCDLLVLN